MVRDAEQHASEDLARKELIEIRNTADSAVYSAEKMLTDNAEQIPDAMKSEIEAEMSTVREAMNNEDVEAIRTGVDKLQAVMQQAGAAMYQQQGGDAGPGAPGADGAGPSGSAANGAADDDVVEGEFSEA